MAVLPTFVIALLGSLQQAPQQAPEPVAEALRRFDVLPTAEQELVAEEMLTAVLAAGNPLLQAAAAAQETPRVRAARRIEADPERCFAASSYAPALGLKTRILDSGDAAWRAVVRDALGGTEPTPAVVWRWDAGRDALIRPATAATPRATVEALLAGRLPADGLLTACAAGALDGRVDLGARADYFAHHYRDRNGRVYRGITLDDVWGSGRELEVSDVEAIAWLRTVEKRTDLVSPLPQEAQRPIYARIRDGEALVREERVLREALAARLVDPSATLPPTLRGVSALIDDAWVALRHDPARMEELLTRCGGRAEALRELATRVAGDGADAEAAAARALDRAARSAHTGVIAGAALDAARDAGLLGIGRR